MKRMEILILILFQMDIYLYMIYYNMNQQLPSNPITTKPKRSKVVIITGGNSGIGYIIARELYRDGYHILIGAFNQQKNQQAVKNIQKQVETSKGSVAAFKLDLADKVSIENFVEEVKPHIKKVLRTGKEFNPNMKIHIDILINCAEILRPAQLELNKQGIQLTLAVNHFGHFYLTYLLYPSMAVAKNTRIINVTSDWHMRLAQNGREFGTEHLWNLSCKDQKYDPFEQYAISKVYNNLFTVGLQDLFNWKHEDPKYKSICVHPGFVSPIFGNHNEKISSFEEGAASILILARRGFIDLKRGQYYNSKGQDQQMSEVSKNPNNFKHLWELSEKIFGINFR